MLLDEYKHLSGPELGLLKKQGIHVTQEAVTEETLDMVYTGDTTFKGLLSPQNSFIFKAEVFIMECTYLDGPPAKALEWQHVHLQDIIDNSELFDDTKQLVLTHLSSRNMPWSRAVNTIQGSQMPDSLMSRTVATLRALGASTDLTALRKSEAFNYRRRHEAGFGWGQQQQQQQQQQRAHSAAASSSASARAATAAAAVSSHSIVRALLSAPAPRSQGYGSSRDRDGGIDRDRERCGSRDEDKDRDRHRGRGREVEYVVDWDVDGSKDGSAGVGGQKRLRGGEAHLQHRRAGLSRSVCRYFPTTSGCANGKDCVFQHML